ncbi:MAG: pimeloyl-ACP methyl ester carboxylesterase [Hyphomicrobiaceae bacterium]|jgi:pimeloyl-ACP methyl ester carboxylesterase
MIAPITERDYDIQQLGFDRVNEAGNNGRWHFVWAHGWGQNRAAMKPLAQSLFTMGTHDFIDFPGFGTSPKPDAAWDTADYADFMADWLKNNATGKPIVWSGHSFGCRVGLQLAARHPGVIDRMLLVAGAGLPRKRSAFQQAKLNGRIYSYKALKRLAPLAGISQDQMRDKFGSSDYKAAGAMRDILIKVVNEDLSEVATKITCPVQLVYGSGDTETPPDIGERLEKLIPSATLAILDGLDHYSVLGDGRHQVAKRLKTLLEA